MLHGCRMSPGVMRMGLSLGLQVSVLCFKEQRFMSAGLLPQKPVGSPWEGTAHGSLKEE